MMIFLDRRNFCRVTDSRCTDLYMEELFESGAGDGDPFDDFRNILYPAKIENLTEEQKLEGPKNVHFPYTMRLHQM